MAEAALENLDELLRIEEDVKIVLDRWQAVEPDAEHLAHQRLGAVAADDDTAR